MTEHIMPNTLQTTDARPVIHGAENFTVSETAAAIPEGERVAVTREDLKMPELFEEGDTIITLVCNVKDIRTKEDGKIGELYPEQEEKFRTQIKAFIEEAYEKIPEGEKDKLDVLVLAGDTRLITPGTDGLHSEQQRAVLTGKSAIDAIKVVMQENGILESSHLIADGDKPVAISHLRDVKMLHQRDMPNVKKFMDFMIEKYGTGRDLWMAYEDDSEQELREQLGVEGPNEIAERMDTIVELCGHMAELCRQDDPSRRVIVLAVGHYDNISPWAKQNLMGIKASEGFIPVEKGAGVVIKKSTNGQSETIVGGRKYQLK